jgi:hypothetical protein
VERPVGIANTDVDKSARASLKHVGEVLRPLNETSVPIDMRLAHEFGRSVSNELCLGRIIDQLGPHREVNLGGRAKCRGDARSNAPHAILDLLDGSFLNVRNLPRITAVCGMTS